MKITFYYSDKELEKVIAAAFCAGVHKHGHKYEVVSTENYEAPLVDTDVAVMIGVKGKSKKILEEHKALGREIVYIDKGYFRIPPVSRSVGHKVLYYKVSLGSFQPLKYLMQKDMGSDRWKTISKKHGFKLLPRKESKENESIVYGGSSQKYFNFHSLGDANGYAEKLFAILKRKSNRDLVYRPKQSWTGAKEIEGVRLSKRPLEEEFKNAFAYIVHGSNSSVNAILYGLPVVSLGPSISNPVANLRVDSLNWRVGIKFPTDEERLQWVQNVCYWQWTLEEMSNGSTWRFLSEWL